MSNKRRHHVQVEEDEEPETTQQEDGNGEDDSNDTVVRKAPLKKPSSRSNGDGYPKLSDREQKLFDLRMKLNKARKMNNEEVVQEDIRKNEGAKAIARKEREEYEKQKENEKKEMMAEGLDPEKERLMHVSAAEAEFLDKKSKKKKEGFGWELYNEDSAFNSYGKRLKEVKVSSDEYEQQKQQMGEKFYPDANNLSYGQAPAVSQDKLTNMVDELNSTVDRRKRYSRHRSQSEDAYVTYVNERNKVFNQKIARAFNQYTNEIRSNLERGTAL